MIRAILLIMGLTAGLPVLAQDDNQPEAPQVEAPMSLPRLMDILLAVDPELRTNGTAFEMTVADLPVTVITDPIADRMRALIPIRSADGMSREELERVMQANFDTTLDARYAVAQGRLWAVYIHPLAALERDQLLSALGQLVNSAHTYGTDYSGGLFTFGGGDSARMQRERIEDLLRRGEDI